MIAAPASRLLPTSSAHHAHHNACDGNSTPKHPTATCTAPATPALQCTTKLEDHIAMAVTMIMTATVALVQQWWFLQQHQ
ncbi:hypothetical protein BC828DRAFT_409838 [Blastocladiella britannica]|nr:hypothetical protein BC828DRAFT_409838 [Blastocladiella britannica]